MTYLKNAWYGAAYSDEVADAPLGRTLLDEPVVIYRPQSGGVVMLADRCPHRFAPLSQGKVVGEDLQCPYHGLRFDGSGACAYNPHGDGVPPANAKVRAYPTLERYGVIWFWPGDPAMADPAALPTIGFLEQPDRFKVVKGRLHVRGNYELIVDNLLDLSHGSYLHPQFGATGYSPEQLLAATTVRLERQGRSIVNHRVRQGLPAPAPSQRMFGFDSVTPCNTKSTMTWYPPAILDFDAGTWTQGTPEEDGALIPQLHIITPETELSSHYFFINGRNQRRDDAEIDKAMLDFFDLAFHRQDEPMIEFVQSRMGETTDIMSLKPILLATDAAPISARRLLSRFIAEERQAPATQAAAESRNASVERI